MTAPFKKGKSKKMKRKKTEKPDRRKNIFQPLLLSLLAGSFLLPALFAEASGIRRSIRKRIVRKVTPKSHLPPITAEPSSDILISNNSQEQCKASVFPSFINHSMGWSESSARHYGAKSPKIPILGKVDHETPVYKGFQSVSPPSIHVVAAGNEYPTPLSKIKTNMSKNLGAIIVGAMGPDGRRSPYSSEGGEVHIMAPSSSPGQNNLTSANDDGRFRAFGGTSGATPLVTGSLAGFEWLAGYHPTAKEAKALLAKTAIMTRHSNDKPRKNGVGMVNAYKLAMVGKRLKAQCGRDLDCFRRKIQDDATYKFPEDTGLEAAMSQAFPQCTRTACAGSNVNSPPSCRDKDAVFKRLRRAAFLNPQNGKLWRQISCIYSEGGFHKNSEGALSIYKSLSGPYGKNSRHCEKDEECVLVPQCGKNLSMFGGSGKLLRSKSKFGSSSKFGGSGKSFGAKSKFGSSSEGKLFASKNKLSAMNAERAEASKQREKQKFIPMNLIAAEEHYVQCMGVKGGAVLCNGKCRCGREETIVSKGDNTDFSTSYQSRCIKSRCVMDISSFSSAPLPPQGIGEPGELVYPNKLGPNKAGGSSGSAPLPPQGRGETGGLAAPKKLSPNKAGSSSGRR